MYMSVIWNPFLMVYSHAFCHAGPAWNALPVSRTMHCLCLTLGTSSLSSDISASRPSSAIEVVFVCQRAIYISYLYTYL